MDFRQIRSLRGNVRRAHAEHLDLSVQHRRRDFRAALEARRKVQARGSVQ